MNCGVKLGRYTLPGLMIGSSPFCGSRQFGEKADRYRRRFFGNPSNMTELLVDIYRRGYPSAHILPLDPMGEAVLEAYRQTGEKFPIIATLLPQDKESQWRWLRRLKTAGVFLHAGETDTLNISLLGEFSARCRREGTVPGFATHRGGDVIPAIDGAGIDAEAYLCPVNASGAHLHPSASSVIEAVKNTPRQVIGMKILACGNLDPREAFPFALPYVNAVVVGMVTTDEIARNIQQFEKHSHLLGTLRRQAI